MTSNQKDNDIMNENNKNQKDNIIINNKQKDNDNMNENNNNNTNESNSNQKDNIMNENNNDKKDNKKSNEKDNNIMNEKSSEKDNNQKINDKKDNSEKEKPQSYEKIKPYKIIRKFLFSFSITYSFFIFIPIAIFIMYIVLTPSEPVLDYVSEIVSDGCISVQFRNNFLTELSQIRSSLRYHINKNDFSCAMDIGKPPCLCILKLNSGLELEMFNAKNTSFPKEYELWRNPERSHFCKSQNDFYAKRLDEMWGEFSDSSGKVWERKFEGEDAFHFQQMLEAQHGHPQCPK